MLLFLAGVLPGAAQFQAIDVWFVDAACASCVESLPERVRRLRGVESAALDAREGRLEVRLAETNRVRLEQIRDLIEQDGTKATRAVVRVTGDLSSDQGRWTLRPAGVPRSYWVEGPHLAAGRRTIAGEVADLRADPIRITVSPPEDR
ncbi:MAG: heavy-metal-associated domain-containing protein [Bryobacteraceae bacterium]|nr:heavy-metal-associated domain-containing protein [Bryobacteraceae bacterium]